MPHYKFALSMGAQGRFVTGLMLKDSSEARVMALQFAGDLLKSEAATIIQTGGACVEVSDCSGLIFSVQAVVTDASAAHPRRITIRDRELV